MTEIAPAETFDGVKGFGMRPATIVEPTLVVEAARVDNEPVTVPPADGIAEPRGRRHRRMTAAIRENLPETGEFFIKNQGQARVLHNLHGNANEHLIRNTVGQTARGWPVGHEIRLVFLIERR